MPNDDPQRSRFGTHVEQEKADLPYKVPTGTPTTVVTDECNVQQDDIKETIDILTVGIEALHDDLQQLSNESLQLSQSMEATNQSLGMLKNTNEESNAGLDALNTNTIILQQDCSSLKQRVEERQFISYDGILVWKITNVQEKMSNTFQPSVATIDNMYFR
jgi:chromosome segregation ATPase